MSRPEEYVVEQEGAKGNMGASRYSHSRCAFVYWMAQTTRSDSYLEFTRSPKASDRIHKLMQTTWTTLDQDPTQPHTTGIQM